MSTLHYPFNLDVCRYAFGPKQTHKLSSNPKSSTYMHSLCNVLCPTQASLHTAPRSSQSFPTKRHNITTVLDPDVLCLILDRAMSHNRPAYTQHSIAKLLPVCRLFNTLTHQTVQRTAVNAQLLSQESTCVLSECEALRVVRVTQTRVQQNDIEAAAVQTTNITSISAFSNNLTHTHNGITVPGITSITFTGNNSHPLHLHDLQNILSPLPALQTLRVNTCILFAPNDISRLVLQHAIFPSLTTLALTAIPTLTGCDLSSINSLRHLSLCHNPHLSEVVPGHVTHLEAAGNMSLLLLDCTAMLDLRMFDCVDNRTLTTILASELPRLSSFYSTGNTALAVVDLHGCGYLHHVHVCHSAHLALLDLRCSTGLTTVYAHTTPTLRVNLPTHLPHLHFLGLINTAVTDVNVADHPSLHLLELYNNIVLQNVNAGYCSAMQSLTVSSNEHVVHIYAAGCPKLTSLRCAREPMLEALAFDDSHSLEVVHLDRLPKCGHFSFSRQPALRTLHLENLPFQRNLDLRSSHSTLESKVVKDCPNSWKARMM